MLRLTFFYLCMTRRKMQVHQPNRRKKSPTISKLHDGIRRTKQHLYDVPDIYLSLSLPFALCNVHIGEAHCYPTSIARAQMTCVETRPKNRRHSGCVSRLLAQPSPAGCHPLPTLYFSSLLFSFTVVLFGLSLLIVPYPSLSVWVTIQQHQISPHPLLWFCPVLHSDHPLPSPLFPVNPNTETLVFYKYLQVCLQCSTSRSSLPKKQHGMILHRHVRYKHGQPHNKETY